MSSRSWPFWAVLLARLTLLQRSHGARLLVFTVPGGYSHHMQGLAIARSLQKRGHQVHVLLASYDHEPLTSKGVLSGVQTVQFQAPGDSVQQLDNLLVNFQSQPQKFMKLYIDHYEGQCRHLLRDAAALAALRQAGFDAMIADNVNGCAFLLAELLQLPRIDLSVTELVDPFWSHYYKIPYSPAQHPYLGSGQSFFQRAANALLSPIVYAIGDPLAHASTQRLAREIKLTGFPSRAAAHRTARLLLVNVAVGVSQPRSLPPHVKYVGPLLSSPAKPLPAELAAIMAEAGERGAVFASFGSVFKPRDCNVARGLASALAALNRTVIWGVGPSDFSAACPLESLGLPPRVHTVPWVPQSDLLGHPGLKAFVSHGGLNSIYEAAYHGTPVVCLPYFGDHLDSCAKAVNGGWGLRFDPTKLNPGTAPELAASIAQVASEASFARSAARVSAMLRAHPRPPAEQAADWVEYALALPEGDDLWDPAVDLPWWQWLCLDVYAAAAAALAAALGVLGLALRAAWRAGQRWRQASSKQKQL